MTTESPFATVAEHWAHYLERDMPREASEIQVMAMKHAFAAGAISGLQLCLLAHRVNKGDALKADLLAHIEDITNLSPRPAQ